MAKKKNPNPSLSLHFVNGFLFWESNTSSNVGYITFRFIACLLIEVAVTCEIINKNFANSTTQL